MSRCADILVSSIVHHVLRLLARLLELELLVLVGVLVLGLLWWAIIGREDGRVGSGAEAVRRGCIHLTLKGRRGPEGFASLR